MFSCSFEKFPKSPLFQKIALTVPLIEMPNCSPESTFIPSYLEIFTHVPMFLLIKKASSLISNNPPGGVHLFLIFQQISGSRSSKIVLRKECSWP